MAEASKTPHIVTSKEARYNRWLAWYHDGCPEDCQSDDEYAAEWPDRDEDESKSNYIVRNDIPELLAEVATEPDRTRAAVVKALRDLSADVRSAGQLQWSGFITRHADAIENGADW